MTSIERAFLAGRSESSWKQFLKNELILIPKLTRFEIVCLYAHFIASNPDDNEVIGVNNLILSRFSNKMLAEIKNQAWRINYKLKPYERMKLN